MAFPTARHLAGVAGASLMPGIIPVISLNGQDTPACYVLTRFALSDYEAGRPRPIKGAFSWIFRAAVLVLRRQRRKPIFPANDPMEPERRAACGVRLSAVLGWSAIVQGRGDAEAAGSATRGPAPGRWAAGARRADGRAGCRGRPGGRRQPPPQAADAAEET